MNVFNSTGDSLLVANMDAEANQMETFPVLIGDEIAYFHQVSGGMNGSTYVVNFHHLVQEVGSPNHIDPEQASHSVEAHLDPTYFSLDVSAVKVSKEYPDEPYVLSLLVSDYMSGEHSFSEALSANIDKRETRFDSNV